MNARDRRQYHRQTFQHDVLIVVRGFNPVACQVVNVCDGGVCLSNLQSPELVTYLASHPNSQVLLHFMVESPGHELQRQVIARLRRHNGDSIGLQFEGPEPALVAQLLQTPEAHRRHALVDKRQRQALWRTLNHSLPRRLQDLLDRFVDSALELLNHAMLESDQYGRIQAFKGAYRQLSHKRDALVQDYKSAFGHRVEMLHRGADAGAGQAPLQVVDKSLFEDWLTLQMIATGVVRGHQNELFRLNQLLSQLAARPLTDRNNPLAPQSLCELLQRAVRHFGFNNDAIPLLYAAFDQVLHGHWSSIIAELNQQLTAGGLRALDLTSMPTNWSQSDPVEAKPDAPDRAGTAEQVTEAISPETARPRPVVARGNVLRLVGLQRKTNARGDDPAPEWSGEQLSSMRVGVRQVLSESSAGIEQALERCLAESSDGLPVLDSGTRDRARLADQLFAPLDSQARLSPGLRDHLHQLRLPVLQVLLDSPAFLDDESHPARDIINKLMQLCLADRSSSKSIERTVTEVVDQLLDASELDEDLFNDIGRRLGTLVERQEQAFVRNAERIAKTLDGQQRLKQTREDVQRRINLRLAGLQVPVVLLDLLEAGWEQLMVLAVLKEGPQSDTVASLFSVIDHLQNWLSGDDRREDQAFERELESSTLLEQVSRELMNLADASHHRELIRRLQDQLQDRAEPECRLLSHYPPNAPTAPVEPQQPPAIEASRWSNRAQALTVGDWVSVRQDDGEPRRMRLVWGDDSAYRFVFLTPQGLHEVEYDLPELVEQMRVGQIRQVDRDRIPFVDQSLFGIVQNVYREMTYQATHDPLTGCLQRHEFEKQLTQLLLQSRTNEQPGTLITLDVDQFSVINAGYGTSAGDAVLKDLSAFLSGFETQDVTTSMIGRLGGNEFGLALLPMSVEDSLDFAERIRREFEAHAITFQGEEIRTTLSLSVNVIAPQASEIGMLLNNANQTLKAGKRFGGNRVRFSSEEAGASPSTISWVSRIDRALEEGSLTLRAQRIQPVTPGSAAGGYYEILLGLRDENGKFISPQSFVEAAELYRRNTRVDRWVLDQTIAWVERNPEVVAQLDGLNINLSGASLSDDAFLDYVASVIKRPSVPADKLCFEVTETAAVASLHYTADFMREMKRLDCRFALDDFGTGMSSYAYLQHLPVDFVKIDGIFVRDIADNLTNYAMVRSINELSHFLGIQTIAEFVEDMEALETLQEINVDFAQGYGISRPRLLETLKPERTAH